MGILKLKKLDISHKNVMEDNPKAQRDSTSMTSAATTFEQPEERTSSSTSTEQRQTGSYSRSSSSVNKILPFNIFLFFNIPVSENILGTVNCGLQGNTFTRGTLVLLNHFLVFYARVLQHKLGFCIPLQVITQVEPCTIGILVQKALKITMEGEKPLIFSSFTSRRDAYQQIVRFAVDCVSIFT